MLFRNPAHGQAIQYAQHGLVGGPTQVPTAVAAQPHLSAPQSTLAATFINPGLDATAVLPTPEPTALPGGALFLQPTIDYSHQYYPHPQQLTSLDILQSLQKPHPSNLLESYVPSSVIWAAQRQRNAGLFGRQFLHPNHGNFAGHTLAHPLQQFYQHGLHPINNAYNTIAYSTAQGYSKRSPKLVTERPLKLKKRNWKSKMNRRTIMSVFIVRKVIWDSESTILPRVYFIWFNSIFLVIQRRIFMHFAKMNNLNWVEMEDCI